MTVTNLAAADATDQSPARDHPRAVSVGETQMESPLVHSISVEHSFETAHRLPQLGGKCTSLHGHSWRVTVRAAAENLDDAGTVVEFGAFKAGVRRWIDTYLDHGTMLGDSDPLVDSLETAGCKVFRFGREANDALPGADHLAVDLPWPTVEAVAVLLWRMSAHVLTDLPCVADTRVDRVVVRETQLNCAEFGPGGGP